MNISNIIKQNPVQVWKWVAIILFCMFFLQTCSKCSHNQNAVFSEINNREIIDSLKHNNKELLDSILILTGNLQTCDKSNQDLHIENDHLRDIIKQSQLKPVIIYKETNTN